jgi:indolepyruvate ferredoxin oxidoreductase
VRNRDFDFQFGETISRLTSSVCKSRVDLDFHSLADRALGDSIFANPMMLGFAYQSGLVPLSAASLERAMVLNGKAVDSNIAAFRWGRWFAQDSTHAERLGRSSNVRLALADMSIDEIIGHRSAHLGDYQDRRLAATYLSLVSRMREVEYARTGTAGLTRAVAINLATVFSPKDEYEVARLFSLPRFKEALADAFEGDMEIQFHLSPPFLARRDKNTGRPAKLTFGPWVLLLFKILAALKWVRGTPLDLFRWSRERKLERRLRGQYLRALTLIAEQLSPNNHAAAVNLANAPAMIRGYGPVKEAAFSKFDEHWPRLLNEFDAARTSSV